MPGSTLESATADDAPVLAVPAQRTRRPRLLARILRSPGGVIGLSWVVFTAATARFAGTIAPGDPFDTSAGPALRPPSRAHVFGTDNLGRDVFTGVVHGASTSMSVVFSVVLISSVIGIALGVMAGFRGGILDDLVMRVAEMFQVVPRFFLALLSISFFGPGLDKLILLLGLTSWPFLARVVRAETIGLKSRDYIQAAAALGATRSRILLRHLIPNVAPPVVVVIALFASRVIMLEAGLAFLGLGDPDRISWGSLANNAQDFLRLAWWMAVFPGLAIVMTVLGLNLLADALNGALRRR